MRLSRSWLTASLVAVTLIPVVLALTVWLAVPSTPEPRLNASVSLEAVSWPPGAVDARLMPGMRIGNATSEQWRNVSVGVNNQFYFYSPDPVEAGSDLTVPLAFFRTSGNQPYRPTVIRIKKLTVFAQLPSGRRAVFELIDPQDINARLGTIAAPDSEPRSQAR